MTRTVPGGKVVRRTLTGGKVVSRTLTASVLAQRMGVQYSTAKRLIEQLADAGGVYVLGAEAPPEVEADPRDLWSKALHLLAATRGLTNLRKGPNGSIVVTFPPEATIWDIADFEVAIEETLPGASFTVISADAPVVKGQPLAAL